MSAAQPRTTTSRTSSSRFAGGVLVATGLHNAYDRLDSLGAVLEQVILPAQPSRLMVLPNTQTLIAVAGGAVLAIDLR